MSFDLFGSTSKKIFTVWSKRTHDRLPFKVHNPSRLDEAVLDEGILVADWETQF